MVDSIFPMGEAANGVGVAEGVTLERPADEEMPNTEVRGRDS